MSRHLDHLQHLLAKLELRYGNDDDSVSELKIQLTALEELEARTKQLRANRDAPVNFAKGRPPSSDGVPGLH